MLRRVQTRKPADANVFLASDRCFPQTLAVLRARPSPRGSCLLARGDAPRRRRVRRAAGYPRRGPAGSRTCGRSSRGARGRGARRGRDRPVALRIVVAAGRDGRDVVLGSAQPVRGPARLRRPHAGVLRDARGARPAGAGADHRRGPSTATARPSCRCSRATPREKATSNICTAQALLANMAGFYAVYQPDGLRAIADRVHDHATRIDAPSRRFGYRQLNARRHFSTGCSSTRRRLRRAAGCRPRRPRPRINPAARRCPSRRACDETDARGRRGRHRRAFARARGATAPAAGPSPGRGCRGLARTSPYLIHPVFNQHRSETQMMRYLARSNARRRLTRR